MTLFTYYMPGPPRLLNKPALTNIRFMKNADRPFIGIIIVTIAALYGIIALLS